MLCKYFVLTQFSNNDECQLRSIKQTAMIVYGYGMKKKEIAHENIENLYSINLFHKTAIICVLVIVHNINQFVLVPYRMLFMKET